MTKATTWPPTGLVSAKTENQRKGPGGEWEPKEVSKSNVMAGMLHKDNNSNSNNPVCLKNHHEQRQKANLITSAFIILILVLLLVNVVPHVFYKKVRFISIYK